MTTYHEPVMAAEVAEVFEPLGAGLFVDATLGGGGHAEILLDQHPQRTLLGIDRDPEAIAAARQRLERFGDRVAFATESFDRLGELVDALDDAFHGALVAGSAAEQPVRPQSDSLDPAPTLQGVLFDFGVSSHQLDTPERGFSHRFDAPLDMRMDQRCGRDAAFVVNTYDAGALADMLRRNADERYAGRIAAAIVAARPLRTTHELADVVRQAVPAAARRGRRHPAMRTFAAIRIEVNNELDLIEPALRAALSRLAPGGRLATLTYHSGEDSIVKINLRKAADGVCECPATLPCICGATPSIRLLKRKVRKPGQAETQRNPRAGSARMRVAERLSSLRGR